MAYYTHFQLADDMIAHLNTVISSISDPFVSSRYVGFVSVAAVTVYELAIKEIFVEFAKNKNKVFGSFAESHFDRINGRIKNSDIRDDYIKRFGPKYVDRYKKKLDGIEKRTLISRGKSIKAAYANIIIWRNDFAHGGHIPSTVTYQEVVEAYELGKELINCVAKTMSR